MSGASARRVALRSLLTLLCALGCAGAPTPAGFDPVSMDPPDDPAHPARLAEGTVFESGGAHLNAIVYEAAGAGPHPTAILLHGFPGNERNLDLAQALRRAGWDVVFFHYRGSWGSGGDFSFSHVLEDVAAVLAQVRAPAFATEHRIDPERIALIGHSMGGFATLIVASEQPGVACAVSLAGANFGLVARALADPAQARRAARSFERSGSGPIPGISGERLVAELEQNAQRFDLVARADALAAKPVLLVAGSRDEVARPEQHHAPLVAALEARPGAHVRAVVLDADHAFSGRRIALTRAVLEFLAEDCPAAPR